MGRWRPVWRAADVVKQMDEKEQFGVKRDWQRKLSPYVCMAQEKGIAVLDMRDDQKSAIRSSRRFIVSVSLSGDC